MPCLRDVADFKKTVALAKYAPLGQRGFIKGRGTGFGQLPWAATDTLEAYYANSNDRLMVIPQCETKESLEHIEDIAAMEGIDGIFVGPFDLSTSMGLPGQFTHPDFLAAKARIFQACQRAQKPCYIFTTKAEEAAVALSKIHQTSNRKVKGALPDGRNFAMNSFSIDKERIACYT